MKVRELKSFLSKQEDEMEVKLLVNTVFNQKCECEIGCIHAVLHPEESQEKNYILIGD